MKLKSYLKYISNHRFKIGFIESDLADILAHKPFKIKVIKHNYHDRWFADPFILDVTDNKIVILVEEFLYNNSKGRLAKLTIDRKSYRIITNETILDLPTHLSFPLIRRTENEIFICPENAASGEWNIYRFDGNVCTKMRTLFKKAVFDAVDITIDNTEYMFATEGTKFSEQNGKCLSIYKKESCQYKFLQHFFFDENLARMAGDFFYYNNELYRPAQENNHFKYGHALSFQKVTKHDDKFEFTEVCRIQSNSSQGRDGMHTFNTYKGVIVVDLKKEAPKAIIRLKQFLNKFSR